MITLFSLVLFCTCDTFLSASCQVLVFSNRTKDVRKFDCFQILQEGTRRSCAQRRKFSSVTGQLQKKAKSPLHNVGLISRSDHLWVCRVSAMMITLSFESMFCAIPGERSCVQRRRCSGVTGQLLKKSRSPLHIMGTIFRSDHLWVCRVSAMIITLSLAFAFCNKSISSEHISTGLSISSS